MASDSLKQVGRYIGKTGRDADLSLKRNYPIDPRVERTRDVFDSTIPFEMDFNLLSSDERVVLDLYFTLPPPIRGCKAGCIFTKCEEFDFPAGGSHEVAILPYLAGSVSVFVNGDRLPDTSVNEIDVESGRVFFQGTAGPDIVAICYVYSECPEEPVFPKCPALNPSFAGAGLAFSDRFDRTPSVEPYGQRGYWFNDIATEDVPVALTVRGGAVNLTTTRNYIFEDSRGSETIFEILAAVDMTNASTGITITLLNETLLGSLDIFSAASVLFLGDNLNHNTLTVGKPYLFNSNDIQRQFTTSNLTLPSPIDLHQKLYVRFFFDGNIYQVKVWPQNEDEPVNWVQFLHTLPTTTFGFFVPGTFEWAPSAFHGARLQGNGSYLQAIQHWVGRQSDVYGLTEYQTIASWSHSVCHSSVAGPAGTYFDLCGSETDSIDVYTDTAGTLMSQISPRAELTYTWSQFVPVTGYIANHFEGNVTGDYSTDKPTSVRVRGEVLWEKSNSSSADPTLSVAIVSLDNGNATPSTAGDYFGSTVQDTVTMPKDTWMPFEAVIPVVAGKIHWGAHFVGDIALIGQSLGIHTGSGLLPRTLTLDLSFRNLDIAATMEPIVGAKPFCPDYGTLSTRCQQVGTDALIGPTYDYSNVGPTDFLTTSHWTSSSGISWQVFQHFSTRVEFNNSFKVLFKPNGITLDGSDGKSSWRTGVFVGDVSVTDTNVTIGGSPTPLNCGNASIKFQFRFSNVGSTYSNVTETKPGWGDESPYTPYGILTVNNIEVSVSNNSAFKKVNDIFYDLQPNTNYNFRMDLTDTLGVKVWEVGTPEPGWLTQAPLSPFPESVLFIDAGYFLYVDSTFTWEVSNVIVSSIG